MEGSVGSQPAAREAVGPGGQSEPPLMCLCLSNGKGLAIRRTQGVLASCACVEVWTSRRGAAGPVGSYSQKLGRLGSRGTYLVVCMPKPSCWRDPHCTYVCAYIIIYVTIISNN